MASEPVSAHDAGRELRKRLRSKPGSIKLHKLLYYCQGWHLAWTGRPLFSEAVVAWEEGPVVADLWHDEKWRRPKPATTELEPELLSTIGYVVENYGHLSGTKLSRLTHEEPPWQDAYRRQPNTGRISTDAMRRFFAEHDSTERLRRLSAAALADPTVRERLQEGMAAPRVRDDPESLREQLGV